MAQRLVLLVIAALLIAQCNSDPSSSRDAQLQPGADSLLRTPMENEEAEVAAVELSRQIIAPLEMYDRIKSDLEGIRAECADSIPHVRYTFRPSRRAGYLVVKIPQEQLSDSTWPGKAQLDSLNEIYRLDTISRSYGDWHALNFEGRFNPVYLVKEYAQVPGILQAYAGGPGPGDGPCLYIYPGKIAYRYFFRNAWGDCLAGCIQSRYYYFITNGNELEYRGNYLFQYDDSTRPAWVDTVFLARKLQEYWVQWAVDSGYTWYPDSAAAWFDLQN